MRMSQGHTQEVSCQAPRWLAYVAHVILLLEHSDGGSFLPTRVFSKDCQLASARLQTLTALVCRATRRRSTSSSASWRERSSSSH